MKITSTVVGIFLSAGLLLGQDTPRRAFDVASIRPSVGLPQNGVAAGVRLDGSQVHATFLTVKDYLAAAYRIKLYQVSGPDWIATERFDITATFPEGAGPAQLPEMLQALFVERFQMKFHTEKKDFPVYALDIAKTGLKMTEAKADPDIDNADAKAPQAFTGSGSNQGFMVNLGRGSSISYANNKLEAKRVNMPGVAGTLERFLDRPVVDQTGLSGSYDFSIAITDEDYRSMLVRSAVMAGVILPPEALRVLDQNPSPSSLFDGLNNLGLTLASRKAPLDVIVIDSISRKPTEN